MASSQAGKTEVESDLSDIKRKLAKRMGVAALMIVGLLGGLAVFDRLSTSNEADSNNAPQFSEPVPVAKKVQTQPVTPAEPAPAAPKENKVAAEPESSAPPVDKSGVNLGLPPPPEVMRPPVVAPAQPLVGQAKNGASQPAFGPAPVKAGKPVRTLEIGRPVEAAKPLEPVKSAPLARSLEPAKQAMTVEPAEPVLPVSPPVTVSARLFSGYALQVGVFSDPRRAEELHARLTQEGIPSFIEARVEVGPFKNREEAEAARAKLGALGLDSVMLSPKKVKR